MVTALDDDDDDDDDDNDINNNDNSDDDDDDDDSSGNGGVRIIKHYYQGKFYIIVNEDEGVLTVKGHSRLSASVALQPKGRLLYSV